MEESCISYGRYETLVWGIRLRRKSFSRKIYPFSVQVRQFEHVNTDGHFLPERLPITPPHLQLHPKLKHNRGYSYVHSFRNHTRHCKWHCCWKPHLSLKCSEFHPCLITWRAHLRSCCTNKVISRPAIGMDLMLLPITYPSATGMMCVTPSPLSTTVPVNAPPFFCMPTGFCYTVRL